MSKLKSVILGVLATTGACVVQAETVSYLDPVFDAKGATSGYVTKSAECTEINWGYNPASGGICGSGSTTLSAGWYVVSGNFQISSTLTVSGDVKLILRNGAKFDVNYEGKSRGGLRVEECSSLTIYAQSEGNGMGQLSATGGKYAAGIGSGSANKARCGMITINGGKITAKGGHQAAGIGGGKEGDVTGFVRINGGEVTATGGENGAGIGGGYKGAGSNIAISGGAVTATSGTRGGAGIGGGDLGIGSNISIYGGRVEAKSDAGDVSAGAGIGGGCRKGGSDIWISGGSVTAKGGTDGANVTISGGTVSATGRDGAADVGGANVRITGGSVVASKVTDPKNADGDAVWCVTVPDVASRGPVAITNMAYLADTYGQTDLYPVGGSLSLWLPDGTYNGFYVGDSPDPYYATVDGEPTVATRKHLDLYVNGELVDGKDHEGWKYVDGVLNLWGTTNYVITGESTAGDVRISVTGPDVNGCNVTLSGVRLGMGDKTLEYNLLWIEIGIVNLTIDGATAFQVNGDKKPIGVNEYGTLNIRGSGTAFAWGVDVVEGGRVTMEDPTSVTFTTQEAAEAAAAVVKPVADENEFPDIVQEAYAERFVVSAVQSGPGTWTLDYQINEATSNELQAAISSVETLTNLVAAISSTNRTATVTITPIPGFYYGMAGTTEVTEMESDAARPPTWYAAQEGEDELEVSGTTFLNAVKAFYQLKATAKP